MPMAELFSEIIAVTEWFMLLRFNVFYIFSEVSCSTKSCP